MGSGDSQSSSALSDVQWCYDAVADVSRTFAITVELLEEPMAREVCVGYLVCRVSDTVEDAGHVPPAHQTELLEQYRDAVDPSTDAGLDGFRMAVASSIPDDPGDDWALVRDADRVFAAFRELSPPARRAIGDAAAEMADGMATFVDRYAEEGGLRIRTVDELEDYCWYVAGTVGELVTDLVAIEADDATVRTLREHAEAFALLLQLVNVARDVAADYREEDNVYAPRQWLREEGAEGELLTEDNRDAVARVVDRIADRAEGYLDDAQAYLEAMPEVRGNRLAAWAMPYLLAVGTLRELRESPGDVLDETVKVSRPEVVALLDEFGDGANPDVGELRAAVASGPYHRTDG